MALPHHISVLRTVFLEPFRDTLDCEKQEASMGLPGGNASVPRNWNFLAAFLGTFARKQFSACKPTQSCL